MSQYNYDFSSFMESIDLENVGIRDLNSIIENLSVDELIGDNISAPFAPNRTTYLYSGYYDINGVSVGANKFANAIDGGRTVDKTVAAKFLTDLQSEILKTVV